MRLFSVFFFLVLFSTTLKAQYLFEGYVDKTIWKGRVYLSLIEDYRQIEGIYDEQIITQVSTDSTGYFRIEGDQLESKNRLYKLHVDNCSSNKEESNHVLGHCLTSRQILFIANCSDTIQFPMSLDREIFCDIKSSNPVTSILFDIDALKEEMSYAFSEFRSKTNRKLNTKKWFQTLQDFGESTEEPLAEIYIYQFLSDRGKQFHDYYLKDIQDNEYYDELLFRLESKYLNSNYYTQYKSELASDRVKGNSNDLTSLDWEIILAIGLIISISLNIWLLFKRPKKKRSSVSKSREQLTAQENKILELLLQNKTNKEIAKEFFVSVSTVKSHTNSIYKKLQVASRQELISKFN